MINETLARRAKENMSFSDYKAGSATAEFNAEIERVKALIEKAKTKVSPEAQERLDGLLSSYTRNYANWINKRNANGAGHVSVMIAGPANYNMRAHEKYLNRERKIWEEYEQFKNIEWKIQSIINGDKVIRSDDKNAVEKIKAKIESLQGTPDPYGNKSAEIRRLKGRLLELAPEEFAEQQANITVNGVKHYDEILALWDNGYIKKSDWKPGEVHYYFYLHLDFYNGKRHYKELLSFEVDESGENMQRFNLKNMETESIPLTDERKYNLIISKISGSGNKAVIYQHLKNLSPEVQAKKATAEEAEKNGTAETVTINGEPAKVVRNKEDMRLQLIFDGKPEEKTRETLKSNGFRWAPSNMAWQRLLNNNAEWALKRIAEA
jgi:hypothetical protein